MPGHVNAVAACIDHFDGQLQTGEVPDRDDVAFELGHADGGISKRLLLQIRFAEHA